MQTDRRSFLKQSLLGGAAALAVPWSLARTRAAESAVAASGFTRRVALTAGNDRADLALQGLKLFDKSIAAAIGNKRVKPKICKSSSFGKRR
jgi:hypothetical protein